MKKIFIMVLLIFSIVIPATASETRTEFILRDDSLNELYPSLSLSLSNNNISYGMLINEHEIIFPFHYRPDYWAIGMSASFDFQYGYDFYVYASGKYDAVINRNTRFATTFSLEAGAKCGIGGPYRNQVPLFYYAPHILLGLSQQLGPVSYDLAFTTFDFFRSEQLLGFSLRNELSLKMDEHMSISLFYLMTYANGSDELAFVKTHQGGISCTYAK